MILRRSIVGLSLKSKPRASGDDPDFFVIADNLLE